MNIRQVGLVCRRLVVGIRYPLSVLEERVALVTLSVRAG